MDTVKDKHIKIIIVSIFILYFYFWT